MVATSKAVLLLRAVHAGVRRREQWSDWPKCGSCVALNAGVMFVNTCLLWLDTKHVGKS